MLIKTKTGAGQVRRDEAALFAAVYGWSVEASITLDLKEAKTLLDEPHARQPISKTAS